MRVERHETAGGTLEVARRAAGAALRPFLIGGLEGWAQTDGAAPSLREVPFPGVPLVLGLDSAWHIDGAQRVSFVAGLYDTPTVVSGGRRWSCLELRLTPLGAHRLLGLPLHELHNRTVELDDLDPQLRELPELLRDADAWESRLDRLEAFLARRLALSSPTSVEVEWSWQQLVRSGGAVPIGTLVRETGWSARRLVARFREQVGLSPKAAARVIRFDRAAVSLRSAAPPSLAALAYDCGYADQSHLNRDFRALAGTTPTAYRASVLESGGVAV